MFLAHVESAHQIVESFSNSISSRKETPEPDQNDDTYRRRNGMMLERTEHLVWIIRDWLEA